MSFYDFDDRRSENEIEPKGNRDDLIDDDQPPLLCDVCPGGVVVQPYQRDKLICPQCMNVYNPTFEHIKHDTIETTIDEYADTHSGQMSYVETEAQTKPTITKIRKKLEVDNMPDYVKREIDHIQTRAGYYRHADNKKLSRDKRTSF
jgi:hypothetical protein